MQLRLLDDAASSLRDSAWLAGQLDHIWSTWFADVERVTPVSIRYVRPWKRRLAVIYLTDEGRRSFIGVNRLMRDARVPYTVFLVTIAHELAHYSHGFGSHHPRRYKHPHRGNVVQRELTRRGLAEELRFYTEWTSDSWFDLLDELARESRSIIAGPASTEPPDLAAAQVD
ncbi:MAG TPA: hypothetical protein VF157_04045 [Chloroflexota bacterium]